MKEVSETVKVAQEVKRVRSTIFVNSKVVQEMRSTLIKSYRSIIYANMMRFDYRSAAMMGKCKLSFLENLVTLYPDFTSDEKDAYFLSLNEIEDELKESNAFSLDNALLSISDLEKDISKKFGADELYLHRELAVKYEEFYLQPVNGDFLDLFPETSNEVFGIKKY
ncbi:hypothetical protein [Proteus mirabilis]|uniref:hypothetical protein n=1 Tax=Proteus mirabilis TaxID=584 RepID=UPI0034D3D1A9